MSQMSVLVRRAVGDEVVVPATEVRYRGNVVPRTLTVTTPTSDKREFCAGSAYVMNERGATVAVYNLGERSTDR